MRVGQRVVRPGILGRPVGMGSRMPGRRVRPFWRLNEENREIVSVITPVALELAFAYVLANLNQLILNLFDGAAVAASTAVGTFVSLVLTMYAVFHVGMGILLAPCWGRAAYREGSGIWTVCLINNVLLSVLIGVVGIFGCSFLLVLLKVPEELQVLAGSYVKIILGFSVFQGITLTFTAAFRAIGSMKTVMLGNTLINGSHAVLNLLFLWFAPAQLQTMETYCRNAIAAQAIGAAFYFCVSLRNPKISFHFPRRRWRWLTRQIFRIGFLGGLECLLYMICQTVVIALIGMLGARELAVKGYTANLINYLILPSAAAGVAASTIIGRSIGQGLEERVKKCMTRCLGLSVWVTLLVEGIVLVIGRSFLQVYVQDPGLLRFCMTIIVADFAVELARCGATVLVASLKAIGDVKTPIYMVLAGAFLNIAVSWLFGLQLGFGLVGIWAGYGVDLIVRTVWGWCCWKKHLAAHSYPVTERLGEL